MHRASGRSRFGRSGRAPRWAGAAAWALACAAGLAAEPAPIAPAGPGAMSVALVTLGSASAGVFGSGFVGLFEAEVGVPMTPGLIAERLDSATLRDHAMVALTGSGFFEMTPMELAGLRDYLASGGVVVASGWCGDAEWALSLREAVGRAFEGTGVGLTALEEDHRVFRTLFDLSPAHSGASRAGLEAVEIDGVARVVLSPLGLNDGAAGGQPCAAGGEEPHARWLLANLLAYAVMH